MPHLHPTLPFLIIGALIAWRVASRIRRLVSRQRSAAWRHLLTAIFFPLVCLLLGVLGLRGPSPGEPLAALLGGAVAGTALAVWSLRTTRYEVTPEGLFYTPNASIGIGLSVLLVGRIASRFFSLQATPDLNSDVFQSYGRSPLTLLIFGTLTIYYAVYAIGLLRWRASAERGLSA